MNTRVERRRISTKRSPRSSRRPGPGSWLRPRKARPTRPDPIPDASHATSHLGRFSGWTTLGLEGRGE